MKFESSQPIDPKVMTPAASRSPRTEDFRQMRYSVSGVMSPEGAFVADNSERFSHEEFEVSVSGPKLTVSHEDTSLGGEAIALGQRYVNMLSAQSGQAITWTPDEYTGVGDDGKQRKLKTFAAVVTTSASLGMVVKRADGREERRTDRDLAPIKTRIECLETNPDLNRAVELAAEYSRSKNLKPLSRLWDVLKAATGESSDQQRHAALAKLAEEDVAWANDVGQSLHAMRHEILDEPRLDEAECQSRIRRALMALIQKRCPGA